MYNPNAFATLQSVGGGRSGLVPSSTIIPGSSTAAGANNNNNAPTITVAGGIPLSSVASPDGLERPVHPHPYFQEWMEFIKLIGHEEAKRLCPEQWSLLHGAGGLAKDMRENPDKYPHLTQAPAVTSNSQAPFKSAPSVSSSNLERESGRRRSRSPRDHHRHHHRSTSDRDKEDRKHHHHRSSRDERDKKDKKDKHHRSSHRDDDRDRRDKRDKYSRRD